MIVFEEEEIISDVGNHLVSSLHVAKDKLGVSFKIEYGEYGRGGRLYFNMSPEQLEVFLTYLQKEQNE